MVRGRLSNRYEEDGSSGVLRGRGRKVSRFRGLTFLQPYLTCYPSGYLMRRLRLMIVSPKRTPNTHGLTMLLIYAVSLRYYRDREGRGRQKIHLVEQAMTERAD